MSKWMPLISWGISYLVVYLIFGKADILVIGTTVLMIYIGDIWAMTKEKGGGDEVEK